MARIFRVFFDEGMHVLRVSLYDMEDGMQYACQRCGNCCRWPGEVPLSDLELERISNFLGLTLPDFIAEYTDLRLNRSGLTLIEKPNHECIFLDGVDCRIQAVKPDQCLGFPNQWNFPGWRKSCEAIPVPVRSATDA